ncbi:DUF1801 domain-containing protein [Microbacterium hominis]|uniref:DUF1801 domain-containing protein n=1 Tax=Microbacterium hominis TaxID=162426 RepID=A0A7D4TIG0_9MICO|nr:DUF1801 domain-containing protein [Microbacterium hominis]QKJ20761.1 DUF1801 domain-containing protein [Microbacterium hominis]
MQKTGTSVASFLAGVTPAKRRADAEILIALMSETTGREPEMWGTIVGFGTCHYRYPTGTEGDAPIVAFSPRRQATTIYLQADYATTHAHDLAELGPHTTGVGCLYIKDLDAVDHDVLTRLISAGEAWVRAGGDAYAAYTVTD